MAAPLRAAGTIRTANRACPLKSAKRGTRRISSKLRKKGYAMPPFMIRWQCTSTSAKALVGKPHDRTGAAKALLEGFGGQLHSYFLALGEYDGVAICEFPDTKS